MSQPFIHLLKNLSESPHLVLSGSDFHHLVRVLRCRKGEAVSLSDGKFIAEAVISRISQEEVELVIQNKKEVKRPASTIALFFSPLKGKRMDWLLEKATEIGVNEFHPVFFQRTVARPEAKKTRLRWEKIIRAAAQQSHQPFLPELFPPVDWKEVFPSLAGFSKVLVFIEDEKKSNLKNYKFKKDEKVAVVIGPEGGFSEEEKEKFRSLGFCSLTLGKQILRAETASLVALTLVSFLLERLS
jgi:16S rRNA (uracil1498-N3)-methyltransferase